MVEIRGGENRNAERRRCCVKIYFHPCCNKRSVRIHKGRQLCSTSWRSVMFWWDGTSTMKSDAFVQLKKLLHNTVRGCRKSGLTISDNKMMGNFDANIIGVLIEVLQNRKKVYGKGIETAAESNGSNWNGYLNLSRPSLATIQNCHKRSLYQCFSYNCKHIQKLERIMSTSLLYWVWELVQIFDTFGSTTNVCLCRGYCSVLHSFLATARFSIYLHFQPYIFL